MATTRPQARSIRPLEDHLQSPSAKRPKKGTDAEQHDLPLQEVMPEVLPLQEALALQDELPLRNDQTLQNSTTRY